MEEWSYAGTISGRLCVTVGGIKQRPLLSAGNLDTSKAMVSIN